MAVPEMIITPEQIAREVEHFGGKTATKPIPMGLVVVTEYKADASWKPRQLTPGQALLALLANTVSARRCPEKALGTLRRVVAQAPTLKGLRGEVSELSQSPMARLEKSV